MNFKTLSLTLNAILLVAVAVLFYLFFTGSSGTIHAPNNNIDTSSTKRINLEASIAYINIDSVLENYDMFNDLQAELQSKVKDSENQLSSQEKTLRSEVEDFQYKTQRGLVTRSEAEKLQQELAIKEQKFYQLQQQLQLKLAEEEQVAHRKVLNSITEYLGSRKDSNSYQYVLGTTFGGNILYANEGLNISKEVIKGLNSEYNNDKEKKTD